MIDSAKTTVEDAAWTLAVASVVVYGTTVSRDASSTLFMTAALGLAYVARRQRRAERSSSTRRADAFWEETARAMSATKSIVTERYDVYRPPKNLTLIPRTPAVRDLLYGIRFVNVYDQNQFQTIVALVETFLRRYFEAMTDKRDVLTTWTSLQSLRRDVLNSMYQVTFNTPKLPRAAIMPSSSDFDRALLRAIRAMQRHTHFMMEALYRKHVASGVIVDALHRAPVPANSSHPADPF